MTEEQRHYIELIEDLHSVWEPHEGQLEIGAALFGEEFMEIMAVCGRNFGKTELIIYAFYRIANLYPGTQNYYFTPEQKQAREILWRSERLQKFCPKFIAETNDTEMRVTFLDGSFVKLDGSDNVDQYRGVKPPPGSLIVYDEYKDFRSDFHAAMEPNLQHCKLFIVGTPPDVDNHFTELEDIFKKDSTKAYFNLPSSKNPHNTKAWLARKKSELYAKGEGDVWEREYEAKRVRGGKRSVFPMIASFNSTPHEEVMHTIARDAKKLEWYTIADPGTATCFAVLFAAINPFTKTIYLLDEIYETDQAKTSVRLIGQEIIDKQRELGKGRAEWLMYADEAALWFINEVYDRHQLAFAPTEKAANKKETGLSLVKDILLQGKIVASDRCKKWLWEMQNYIKDDKDKIPKKNDHLIDDLRYLLAAANYQLENEAEPIPEAQREDFRGARIEDDFPDLGVTADEFLGNY